MRGQPDSPADKARRIDVSRCAHGLEVQDRAQTAWAGLGLQDMPGGTNRTAARTRLGENAAGEFFTPLSRAAAIVGAVSGVTFTARKPSGTNSMTL